MTQRASSISGSKQVLALHLPFLNALKEAVFYLAGSPKSYLRQRKALLSLDDRLLGDIGVTRGEALRGRPDPVALGRRSLARRSLAGENPPLKLDVVIRDAVEADMPALQSIYAHEVLHGLASFEETPPTAGELNARREHVLRLGLPYLAAELNGHVVGFAYATKYRPRPAYRHTLEDSVYVVPDLHGQGVGRALLSALISRCELGQWRQMVAVIGDTGNAGSIALHRNLGFRQVGTLDAIGFKCGRWVDTVLMQRGLGCGSGAPPGGCGSSGM